jgi:hypothetical protein
MQDQFQLAAAVWMAAVAWRTVGGSADIPGRRVGEMLSPRVGSFYVFG